MRWNFNQICMQLKIIKVTYDIDLYCTLTARELAIVCTFPVSIIAAYGTGPEWLVMKIIYEEKRTRINSDK